MCQIDQSLSHSLAPGYLQQGPTGKPGLPGMPGADGPPVGPWIRTGSWLCHQSVPFLRALFVLSGSSRKGGAFRHQREPGRLVTSRLQITPRDLNISNVSFTLYLMLFVGVLQAVSFFFRVPVVPRGLLAILVLVASR